MISRIWGKAVLSCTDLADPGKRVDDGATEQRSGMMRGSHLRKHLSPHSLQRQAPPPPQHATEQRGMASHLVSARKICHRDVKKCVGSKYWSCPKDFLHEGSNPPIWTRFWSYQICRTDRPGFTTATRSTRVYLAFSGAVRSSFTPQLPRPIDKNISLPAFPSC